VELVARRPPLAAEEAEEAEEAVELVLTVRILVTRSP
jgi:hypothetical protein